MVSQPQGRIAKMIDYIALSIGHGLMAIALVRLFLRDDVDVDPLITSMKDQSRQSRLEASQARRGASRPKGTASQTISHGEQPKPTGPGAGRSAR